jgi:hypothetical protein
VEAEADAVMTALVVEMIAEIAGIAIEVHETEMIVALERTVAGASDRTVHARTTISSLIAIQESSNSLIK